ncbi:DUF7668 domain-containing protein [Paenibacillus prosopidis]|uniref:DUF7668 domain-containing protein n=1 Tax=Paenibacillus prosopidis TaxID=630520 RepID=A0A368VND1_9BACL|nr:hypothetical protein [Paenibacillus prosopidis]RCW41267.1 hypothetical protein DFP97_1256 [Paenibacillus prosopidis]
MNRDNILAVLKPLIHDLVSGNFELIEQSGRNGPYSSLELKELIDEYGGQLTSPPEDDFININVIEIENEPEYAVEYELWIDNTKSDLTLSCTVRTETDKETISIENIHVL